MTKRLCGYSLIELLVVLAVLALLAGMAMPMLELTAQRERERELKHALWEIRDAIDAWNKACTLGAIALPVSGLPYPPTLAALTLVYADQRLDRRGKSLRFLRKVPRDPFADPALPAEQTWGLRDYTSNATAPWSGREVYDIYSLSGSKGLSGEALWRW